MVYTCFNFKLELRFSVLHSLKRMQNQSESQNIRQSMYINYSCHILKILDNVSKHRKASCGILEELLCNVSTWPIVNRHRAAHMFSGILDKITQDAQLPKANQALVHLTFFNKHCGILEELLKCFHSPEFHVTRYQPSSEELMVRCAHGPWNSWQDHIQLHN